MRRYTLRSVLRNKLCERMQHDEVCREGGVALSVCGCQYVQWISEKTVCLDYSAIRVLQSIHSTPSCIVCNHNRKQWICQNEKKDGESRLDCKCIRWNFLNHIRMRAVHYNYHQNHFLPLRFFRFIFRISFCFFSWNSRYARWMIFADRFSWNVFNFSFRIFSCSATTRL